MDCKSVGKLLDLWLDGELDSARAAEVRAHLDACPECAAKTREMQGLASMLGKYMPAQTPLGLMARTMTAFNQENAALSLGNWWSGLSIGMRGAALGLAAAGLILGLVMAGTLSGGGEVNQYYAQLAALDNGGLWQ